jgi:hypothetical protein
MAGLLVCAASIPQFAISCEAARVKKTKLKEANLLI